MTRIDWLLALAAIGLIVIGLCIVVVGIVTDGLGTVARNGEGEGL